MSEDNSDFEEIEYVGSGLKEEIEKMRTEDKIELIGNWIIQNYKLKRFLLNDVDLGIHKWNGYSYEPYEEQLKVDIRKYAKSEYELTLNTYLVNEIFKFIKEDHRIQYIIPNSDMRVTYENGVLRHAEDFETFVKERYHELIDLEDPDNGTMEKPTLFYIPHKIDAQLLKELFEKYPNVDREKEKEIIKSIIPDYWSIFEAWNKENALLLMELLGYAQYPDFPYGKIVLLKGYGSNGKSTYLSLIRYIVGSRNCSEIPLQELANPNNRFILSNIRTKLVNMSPETEKMFIRYTGILKRLTGETDYVSSEIKFKEWISFKPITKLFFNANELPEINDLSKAMLDRLMIIDFPNEFVRDPTFFNRTFKNNEEKIAKLIAISIWTFYLVLKRNEFSYEQKRTEEQIKRELDQIYNFIQSMIEQNVLIRDPNGKVEKEYLYSLYTKWCNENDLEIKSKREFTIKLEKYGITQVHEGKTNQFYYKGLRKAEDKNILG
jgi:P4 family phage/plasmid primase-like protien